MVEDEKPPNMFYIIPDLLEEIFIRLPSKSILKFRTVSKQWRTILESKSFLERRMNNTQRHWKILAAYDSNRTSPFVDNEEIVYLHSDKDAAGRPSLSCDGLLCFPEQDWIIVVNPLTGQLLRFPSRLDDTVSSTLDTDSVRGAGMALFPGYRAMGFGRDEVTGLYKVVRMCFHPVEEDDECELLDVATGEWRTLSPPPCQVEVVRKSVCVNGSIYWLTVDQDYRILALNLHTQEFHYVSVPDTPVTWFRIQILNLDDRLAIAKATGGHPGWKLKIWSMDKEGWSKTYSISLAALKISPLDLTWFTPLTVCELGNVVFCDNHKRLFKYYTESGEIRCLSSDICVISPYLENLVPLQSESVKTSRCRLFPEQGSKIFKWSSFWIPDLAFASLVIVGYICLRSLAVPCSVSTSFRNLN
ncbi:F-box/kelch-repeat protein [Raphanus sativus]|uniref:F-box/LRR-repeat protein At2g43260-like isoform X2 n=1 Tax=Raphanus sativus TaxID=3726 RepID=A0A9W3BX90_RAPSA|nr:F-box/LRR-repeat protein At2g43260-like isoform X2 [Raphanus sativus]KAJ4892229.1 F-box/kelch-repeat protein [Raphanus sativus]